MSADADAKPNKLVIFCLLLLAATVVIFFAAKQGYKVGSDIAHRENAAERAK